MNKKSLDQLNRLQPAEFKAAEKTPCVLVLDNIRSMHNIGSAFRSADAFRIEKIILCGITATPPHREINKTAIGATETVAWHYEKDTETALKQLKEKGYFLAGIEQTHSSEMLHTFGYPNEQPVAFVLGNEVGGVGDEALALCDIAIEIPQFGTKHSLNVSVVAGILLYHFTEHLLKTKHPALSRSKSC